MKKSEVKEGIRVMDRWYPQKGVGIIKDVKKTVFKVVYDNETVSFDYPHARFLDIH